MNYLYHTQLCAPIADVHELTNLLRQMDFKVVSLLDLNWQEMHSAVTEFLLLLDKGVYGWSLVHLDYVDESMNFHSKRVSQLHPSI